MTQTTIYLSVTHGDDSLTLDGNLYLFRELIAALNSSMENLTAPDNFTPLLGEEKDVNHVSN